MRFYRRIDACSCQNILCLKHPFTIEKIDFSCMHILLEKKNTIRVYLYCVCYGKGRKCRNTQWIRVRIGLLSRKLKPWLFMYLFINIQGQ